jgi:phage-related baseplate assembly protein
MATTPTLDELTTPLTRDEAQAAIYAVLGRIGVSTTSWKPGAVVRTIITGVSSLVASLTALQAQIARSSFLELSQGDFLKLVAKYVFGVDYNPPTFATGLLTIVNSGGGVYALDADDLIVSNGSATYRNVAAVSLAAGATVTIVVRADEEGSGSSAGAGEINQIVTALPGVSCTNPTALVGADVESDASLKTRCYEHLGALSPMGPWDAYSYAVRSAQRDDGSSIGVSRVRVTKDGFGNVYVYVATKSGAVVAGDLAVADEVVQRQAAPLGVTAYTASATEVPVPVTYELWLYNTSGRSEDQIKAAVDIKLASFFSTTPLGGNVISGDGRVYVDAIRAAIASTFPETIHCEVTAPTSDIVLAPSEVAVSAPSTVVGIHQVAPPEGYSAA